MEQKNIQLKSFQDVKKNLSSHVSNKFTFREDQIRTYNGVNFNGDNWSSKNMRRIYFSDCTFINVNFKSTGFTGSIFHNCMFTKSLLDCTIFDECMFIDCVFISIELHSTSFCKAHFIHCKWKNLLLDTCFCTASIFDDMCIANCHIIDIIWENADFLKCKFDDVLLENLNFEFTNFHDIHFNNTAIPFASLPFIFGGIEYILKTADNIFIHTVNSTYPDGRMPKDDYINLIPDIMSFYQRTQNYFPLANLYLGLGDHINGINAICLGLEFWFRIHNFKIMYYLCELANTYNFSISDRKIIYKKIKSFDEWIEKEKNINFQKQWNEYYPKIRECLLTSKTVPYATLEISTNISQNNYQTLSKLMQTMDLLISSKKAYFSLELHHNSPFDLLYKIFSDEDTLINFVLCIATVLGTCNQIYTNHLNNKLSKKNAENYFSDDENDAISKTIVNNINTVNYSFHNCNINELTMNDDHLMRQSKGCENPDSSGTNQ